MKLHPSLLTTLAKLMIFKIMKLFRKPSLTLDTGLTNFPSEPVENEDKLKDVTLFATKHTYGSTFFTLG